MQRYELSHFLLTLPHACAKQTMSIVTLRQLMLIAQGRCISNDKQRQLFRCMFWQVYATIVVANHLHAEEIRDYTCTDHIRQIHAADRTSRRGD